MADVMSHQAICFGFHCKMDEEFIVRIIKYGDPKAGKIVLFSKCT
jgi:hypothetical protein